MANIELVIKMPEEIYKNIQSENFWLDTGLTLSNAYDFIKNGTLLPKGHGRIIDEWKITKCRQAGLSIIDGNISKCLITDAPTIIEAEYKQKA